MIICFEIYLRFRSRALPRLNCPLGFWWSCLLLAAHCSLFRLRMKLLCGEIWWRRKKVVGT